MKRFTLLCGMLLAAIVVFAQAPTLVVEEDFSLFTAGSEASPDATSIAPGGNEAKGDKAVKVIRHGQFLILHDGKTYNVLGERQ